NTTTSRLPYMASRFFSTSKSGFSSPKNVRGLLVMRKSLIPNDMTDTRSSDSAMAVQGLKTTQLINRDANIRQPSFGKCMSGHAHSQEWRRHLSVGIVIGLRVLGKRVVES